MTKNLEMNEFMRNDVRLKKINDWVTTELKLTEYRIEVASADASFRRYFRLICGDEHWIIMDAPPEKEDCQPFIYIAQLIENAGVQAPHIFEFNQSQGFMRLSDLGSTAYLDKLNIETVDDLYSDAIKSIIKMQDIKADLPAYNKELLQFEMNLFKDWYLIKHQDQSLNSTQNKIITNTFNILAESALQQSVVFVHRDYHSRNLMITDDFNPGVIDFQDAVNGPVTYDLVSLIKDCYIAWPRKKLLLWIDEFLKLSSLEIERNKFIKQLDLMGMQRHLKAVGIFARLKHRDSKPAYMNDIPRTLAYIFDVCQRYDELAEFSELLTSLDIEGDAKIRELIL
ncbi:MAG: phosphotransferase [Gammaproteobacteria bacterium]|nr:phosphotransferase [Gammaproteobacteria bacterium]